MIGPVCGIFLIIVSCLLMGACYTYGQTDSGKRYRILRLLVNKMDSSGRDEAGQSLRAYTPPPEYESIFFRDPAGNICPASVSKGNK